MSEGGHGQLLNLRPAGGDAAAVELMGAGIVHLEEQKGRAAE